MPPALSVIIPANNEEGFIGTCLEGILAQDGPESAMVETIVAANGCTDRTVEIARSYAGAFESRRWRLTVLDIPEGGKPGALNTADRAAEGAMRAYLDADVVMSPALLGQIHRALDRAAPAYASGRLEVAPATRWTTRAYARVWSRLPFMTEGVPGAGLFAVNAAGRARWGAFPAIISDDTYARLHFTPEERISVPAPYSWPMVEGLSNLVRVRRRQDAGVAEVAELYPHLMANEGKSGPGAGRIAKIALSDPLGVAVYGGVALAVKVPQKQSAVRWRRGR